MGRVERRLHFVRRTASHPTDVGGRRREVADSAHLVAKHGYGVEKRQPPAVVGELRGAIEVIRGLIGDGPKAAALIDAVEIETGQRLLTRVEFVLDAQEVDRAQHPEHNNQSDDQQQQPAAPTPGQPCDERESPAT
jgi:hypothetical protein